MATILIDLRFTMIIAMIAPHEHTHMYAYHCVRTNIWKVLSDARGPRLTTNQKRKSVRIHGTGRLGVSGVSRYPVMMEACADK